MESIGSVRCKKFQWDCMAQTCALIGPVQCILHRVSCSNDTNPKCTWTVRNKQILEFRVQWGGSGAFVAKKIQFDLMAQTCPLIAPVRHVVHLVSCSNETLTNAPKHYEHAPKHEFRVQWGGSRALIAKNSDVRGTNFCINCTSSAYFASSFMQ